MIPNLKHTPEKTGVENALLGQAPLTQWDDPSWPIPRRVEGLVSRWPREPCQQKPLASVLHNHTELVDEYMLDLREVTLPETLTAEDAL